MGDTMATTHSAKITDGVPKYNVTGSCLWTIATIVPLALLLLIIAL